MTLEEKFFKSLNQQFCAIQDADWRPRHGVYALRFHRIGNGHNPVGGYLSEKYCDDFATFCELVVMGQAGPELWTFRSHTAARTDDHSFPCRILLRQVSEIEIIQYGRRSIRTRVH